MTTLAWGIGAVLLLAMVNYIAYWFGLDVAGIDDPGTAGHPSGSTSHAPDTLNPRS